MILVPLRPFITLCLGVPGPLLAAQGRTDLLLELLLVIHAMVKLLQLLLAHLVLATLALLVADLEHVRGRRCLARGCALRSGGGS